MAQRLRSDRVVIAAPMSFSGSAQRIWHWTWVKNPAAKVALAVLAVMAIAAAWGCILMWYLMWGLLVLPWRAVRRTQRREKAAKRRHHEMMNRL